MSNSITTPPAFPKAVYELFLTECRSHREELLALLGSPEFLRRIEPSELEQEVKHTQNRFHVLRGGSSFLGFATLSKVAEAAELAFQASHRPPPDAIEVLQGHVRKVLAELDIAEVELTELAAPL